MFLVTVVVPYSAIPSMVDLLMHSTNHSHSPQVSVALMTSKLDHLKAENLFHRIFFIHISSQYDGSYSSGDSGYYKDDYSRSNS